MFKHFNNKLANAKTTPLKVDGNLVTLNDRTCKLVQKQFEFNGFELCERPDLPVCKDGERKAYGKLLRDET